MFASEPNQHEPAEQRMLYIMDIMKVKKMAVKLVPRSHVIMLSFQAISSTG
jgi:hypothetical protein